MTKRLFLLIFSALILVSSANADEIELRDGKIVTGSVIARNSLELFVSTSDGVKRVSLGNIKQIRMSPSKEPRFGGGNSSSVTTQTASQCRRS